MTAAALAALDAPHEVLDEGRMVDAQTQLDDFLERLHAVPRGDVDATARRLIAEWRERLEAIPDVISRTVVAQSLMDVIDARAKRDRLIRDISVLVMLRPWTTVQRKYAAEKETLNRARDEGRMSAEEYALAEKDFNERKLHEEKRQPWKPTPACKHAWISRGLYATRIRPREPALAMPRAGEPASRPDMPMEQAEREAERAGRVVKIIDGAVAASAKRGRPVLRDLVEEIRNDGIDMLLSGPRDGGLGIANADVARLLGITTARVAQLRAGMK